MFLNNPAPRSVMHSIVNPSVIGFFRTKRATRDLPNGTIKSLRRDDTNYDPKTLWMQLASQGHVVFLKYEEQWDVAAANEAVDGYWLPDAEEEDLTHEEMTQRAKADCEQFNHWLKGEAFLTPYEVYRLDYEADEPVTDYDHYRDAFAIEEGAELCTGNEAYAEDAAFDKLSETLDSYEQTEPVYGQSTKLAA